MDNKDLNTSGSFSLPQQKVPTAKKNKEWGKACINHYSNYRYTNGSNLRSNRFGKLVNYDLYNGKINYKDVESICNPMGLSDNTWASRFQHYDIISEPIRLLIGEETKRPDNTIVISEAPSDINRKSKLLKDKIFAFLEDSLVGKIDPSQVDPNNPPQTPEEILKFEKYTPSDIIEHKANQLLKVLKKKVNSKLLFSQGWKDVLIAGEEIYWVGILNNEVVMKRVNPVNLTVILDDDTTFIDDAIAVIEERMLTASTILDEFGDELKDKDLDNLLAYSHGLYGAYNNAGGYDPQFEMVNGQNTFVGVTPTGSTRNNNYNNYSIRVTRVEWKSMQEIGELTYTDENGESITEIIDDTFNIKIFITIYPDAKVEWFWINQAWEGIKIGTDIFVGIKAKPNQRRRMDNPYYCRLGYTGFIYEATNSQSVSLIDRLKPYQYLYDIIAYRLELAFASDQGKVFVMDLAQIPSSHGMDMERWMHYLKEMKIAFINSFEESKQGVSRGQISRFNQFTAVDLSLAQSIQQYINMLDYIKQQVYFVSGVTPQRLGSIANRESVGNVDTAVTQSALITEYLYEAHSEVKRRAYTGLIEVAKIAYKNGLNTQYVLDDMGIETLSIEELEFEDSEFSVFVSNNSKDLELKNKLEQLVQVAMQADKADLSTIVDVLVNDSPKDIIRTLQKAEEQFYQRKQQEQDNNIKMNSENNALQDKLHQEALVDKQADRDLQQYIADSTNQTKIQVAEINALGFAENTDVNQNMIPDVIEQGKLALDANKLSSDHFTKQLVEKNKTIQHNDKMRIEKEKLASKEKIEQLKIKQTEVQNKNQIELANKKAKLDKELADKKLQIERIKVRSKPKK